MVSANVSRSYGEMHACLEHTTFHNIDQFWNRFGVLNEDHYVDIFRAGVSRPCVLYKRLPEEKWVNPFNPWIALVLESNMDIQVILDHYACAAYVVGYVNKADRGMSNLHKAVSDMIEEKGEMGYPEVLKALGLNMLKAVEMSAQEAAWFLLHQDMSEKSRAVIYIPTCFPEERVRVRKTNKELEHLPPSSTDVWRENVIDEYQRRPEELKDVCLAEFVSAYTKNREGQYQLRRTECVIR